MSPGTYTSAQPRPDARSRALLDTVSAAPQVPRRIGIQAPGGYGKSALVQELARVYRHAGVTVVDAWHETADLAAAPSVAGASNVVVLADDAHLLSDDRLRGLHGLLEARRLGLVLAYRPWPRPLALGELQRPAGPPLNLWPFTEQQTAEYLGTNAEPALVRFVYAQTGGVPRLVERLASALAWPASEVPGSVLAQFQADLVDLDGDVRKLLLAAATNVELTADLLGTLLGREPATTDELLDAARATGLLGPDGRLVPVARRAVAALSPATHRTAVWQRLAELQLARGGAMLPLARSLRELGAGGAGMAGVFEAAAEEALPDEPALAAELFTAAAAGRPAGARRALAAALAGDLDLGLQLSDPLISAGSPDDRAAGAAVAAAALAHRGQLGRSAELYRWSATPSSVAFATIGFLGTGQLDRAGQPPPDGPPTLLAGAAALMATGVRESLAGSPTTTLSTLVQAATLIEPAGRAVLLPDSPAALAALIALHSGDLDIGESILERAITVDLGSRLMSCRHRLLRAWLQMVRGRTAAAAECLSAAVAGAGGSGGAGAVAALEPRDRLFATALELGIARRNSDLGALHRSWGPAGEVVMRHPVDLFTLLPMGELAVAAARLGEPGRLAAHLRQAYQLLDRLGNPPLWAAPLHWSGVHAAILSEQPAVADEHVVALTAIARHSRYAAAVAAAAAIWVEVLRGTVDPNAVEHAARGLHEAGLSWDATRLAGQAAIRTSDRRVMARLLDCARVLRGRPPAPPKDAAGTADQRAGTAVPPAASRLSVREREVAALLLEGLTYKQIGDQLFISAKTVEHHVARMRQRLGCPSRSDLLARLRAMSADQPDGEPVRRPPWPRRPVD